MELDDDERASLPPPRMNWRGGRRGSGRWSQPAQVFVVAEELEPPPQDGRWGDLAGVGERCAVLGMPGDVDAYVDPVGRLACEGLAGLALQLAGDVVGKRPREDRQCARPGGLEGGSRRRAVVGVAGDAGVVEDEQPAGIVLTDRGQDARRELACANRAELAVAEIEEADGGDAEFGARLRAAALASMTDQLPAHRTPARDARPAHHAAPGNRRPRTQVVGSESFGRPESARRGC